MCSGPGAGRQLVEVVVDDGRDLELRFREGAPHDLAGLQVGGRGDDVCKDGQGWGT